MNYFMVPGIKTSLMISNQSISTIVNAVCLHFEIPFEKLKDKTRKREVVVARQTAMYLLKKYTKASFKSIGEMFGNRDHTTAIHSVNMISGLIEHYPDIRANITAIENKLNS